MISALGIRAENRANDTAANQDTAVGLEEGRARRFEGSGPIVTTGWTGTVRRYPA